MRAFLSFIVVLCLFSVGSCTKCSSDSQLSSAVKGACLFHLETCHIEKNTSKITTKNHVCKPLSMAECSALQTSKDDKEFCNSKNSKDKEVRYQSIVFVAEAQCPQPSSSSDQNKVKKTGACFYDQEICHVSKAEGTRIETQFHKCENLPEDECQAIQEECDALSDECIVLGNDEEEIPRFCFASFAKEGDERPSNVRFFRGAKCPHGKTTDTK